MAEDGPGRPVRPPTPGTHAPRLHTFDDEPSSESASRLGWIRRHPMVVVILIALIAIPFLYRAFRTAPSPESPEERLPEPPAMVPTTVGGPEYQQGLTPLPGPNLSGPVGSSQPLTVRAMGAGGLPIADRWVTFRVVEGSGTLDGDSVRTDEAGLARTTLLMPDHPERLLVVASLGDPELSDARFEVLARPGLPTRVMITGGDGQSAPVGELLPQRLGVRVTDQGGNPVPDVTVTFQVVSGEGLVAPSRTRTDSLGLASAVWRLGRTPGDQLVAAVAPDANARLNFTATAQGDTTKVATPTTGGEGQVAGQPVERGAVSVVPRSFAVGGSFVCAIPGGSLTCRGADDRGQRAGGSSTRFAAVAAGVSHACGLTLTGEASCWGGNESGQLGDGSRTDRAVPVSVRTDLLFSQLVAGASHTCGLSSGGRVLCWGSNLNGQLGDGSRDDRSAPGVVAVSERFVSLAAGWNHTCGLIASGAAYCWGLNDHGQLGDGSELDRLVPIHVAGTFESLVAGSAHTCGIRAGKVFCWGSNAFGQLGDGSTLDRSSPVEAQGLPGTPSQLAAGAVSTCALLTDGTAYCWGQNLHGQLGDGSTTNRATASPVAGGLNFSSVFAGGALTCAFTGEGGQYCWGLNQSGQLGDGTRDSRSVPTRVRSP
jgi:alpha-tubulin suppressor-like RCC1 family protein